MEKYRILCYGDSNTYGYDPRDYGRYDKNHRWPEVLEHSLKSKARPFNAGALTCPTCLSEMEESLSVQRKYKVINAGMNGRSIETGNGENRRFRETLKNNAPINLLILSLGANNCREFCDLSRVSAGLKTMIDIALTEDVWACEPKVIVLAPAQSGLDADDSYLKTLYEQSKILIRDFASLEGQYELELKYVNPNPWGITTSNVDFIHLTEESHVIIGKALAEIIEKL